MRVLSLFAVCTLAWLGFWLAKSVVQAYSYEPQYIISGDFHPIEDGKFAFYSLGNRQKSPPQMMVTGRMFGLPSATHGPAVTILLGNTEWSITRPTEQRYYDAVDSLQQAQHEDFYWTANGYPHFWADSALKDGSFVRFYWFWPGMWWMIVESLAFGGILTTVLMLLLRWRRRRRTSQRLVAGQCTKCGYDRRNLDEMTECPECGSVPLLPPTADIH